MASGAERQRALRARQKESLTRLDIMLVNKDAELIAHNAKALGITKAAYVSLILNDKGGKQLNDKLIKENKRMKDKLSRLSQTSAFKIQATSNNQIKA